MLLRTQWLWARLLFVVFVLKCLLMWPGLILIWHQFYAVTHLHMDLLSLLPAELRGRPSWTQDLSSISSDFNSYRHGFKLAGEDQNHWSWKTKETDRTSLNQNGWSKATEPTGKAGLTRTLHRRWLLCKSGRDILHSVAGRFQKWRTA